jgi:hypothetical protein
VAGRPFQPCCVQKQSSKQTGTKLFPATQPRRRIGEGARRRFRLPARALLAVSGTATPPFLPLGRRTSPWGRGGTLLRLLASLPNPPIILRAPPPPPPTVVVVPGSRQPLRRRHRQRGARHPGCWLPPPSCHSVGERALAPGGQRRPRARPAPPPTGSAGPGGDPARSGDEGMMGHKRRPSKGPLVACQI